MKKIIELPEVNFALSKKAFDNFAEEYNAGQDKLKNKIRSLQYQLFYDILRLYRRELYSYKYENINIDYIPNIYTNRVELGKRLKIDGSTVYRNLQKLINIKDAQGKAIIIHKEKHGPVRNFELLITPQFLLLNDKKDSNYIPTSVFLPLENRELQSDINANCTEYPVKLEPSNNIIINIKGISQKNTTIKTETLQKVRDKLLQEPNKNIQEPNKNTGEQCKNDAYKTEIKRVDFDWYKEKVAKWFLAYILSILYSGRKIYQAEKEKTYQYILQYYFASCFNLKILDNLKEQLKWRVDAVKRHIDRIDFEVQYPFQYLDINNHNAGFINTEKWFFQKIKYEKTKNKRNDAQNKLNMVMREIAKTPQSLQNYTKCEVYVKNNIPHLLPEFYMHFMNFNHIKNEKNS